MGKPFESLGGLVYSTNNNAPLNDNSEDQVTLAPHEQDLRVWLEKNHRGGKLACVIKGFVGSKIDLEDLAKTIKTKCGTGGSVKDNEIIIQGDHRDKIVAMLLQMKYKAKKAGA